ncbi:CoA activase [Lacrimispora amygdalina]|uniref:CoA activase n=1 Tax=Lacrimispora amygdalina TaxID=253257 RepID=A0A3E2NFC8_9FIRM|nr:acyl-CoA dehydratase activase [Clostridium indicum]RFZ79717.1 CoA activase [Clostridium indicum]
MKQISVGIDCGSAACKGVLLKEDSIAAVCVKPTGWNPKETARTVFRELLEQTETKEHEIRVGATGYGRVGIDFAHKKITEITCHASGADYLLQGVRTIIDIGGQDSKVISVENGKVLSFQMNDKCAAGTGRFLEMSAHRMGVDLSDFQKLLTEGKCCTLSSMCAVFADSEIVSLLAAGKTREEIAGGIIQSVVTRVMALAGRIGTESPILLTGGLAQMEGIRKELELQTGCPVNVSHLSRYAGAIGAALKV